MLSLTFLGTSAARPTVERNVSSIALAREGETLLFECGEGTQRQMMKYGVGFTLSDVLFTHFHADHYLGIIGLIRTLGLQGRAEPLRLYGPAGARRILSRAVELAAERPVFPVEIHEFAPGDVLEKREYAIHVVPVEHGRGAVGYVVREQARLGRFDPDKARAMGVPEGPLWGKIHKGEAVEVDVPGPGGSPVRRRVTPDELVGAPRPGRVVVISGDTRPCQAMVEAATGADLLVHEATFGDEERDRARETMHATAVEAAQVALAAGARKLALTHLSARYSAAPEILLREAQAVFAETVVAKDGMTIEVPFRDGG